MKVHTRDNHSVLAAVEKRLLIWIAHRLPAWVHSDHLTVLALAGMAMSAAGYVLTNWDVRGLWLAVAGLFVNWFGDSLDGTLARVRRLERPRYGFYVDHVVDILGATLLFGGLAGSPYMSATVAIGVLAAYLLISAEVYLSTAVQGIFRMSFAGFGPTELRILLAVGTGLLSRNPHLTLGPLGDIAMFDVGGVIGGAGLVIAMLMGAARTTRALARAEPAPVA